RSKGQGSAFATKMSKLSFRARALDATKSMPVYMADEIPDLPDYAAINRSVPQMPTGMEKDEECEHHLQRAISAQQAFGHTGELVIPTPEVFSAPELFYNELYPDNFKLSRQLIHVQPFSIEHDIPDYDMDSEDEAWLNQQKVDLPTLTPLKFEEIMDELEKSSGQHVLTINEAKLLLKEDDHLVIAVYDYWLNKRLKTPQSLILSVKTERRDGTSNNNPYVAFRRRTEKMQTRKNRKNDEASYEKMLKLRRDLSRAVNLLTLVRQREKLKNEHLKRNVDIFEKRYHIGDFSGQLLAEVSALRHIKPSSTYLPINNLQLIKSMERRPKMDDTTPKRKREYKKRSKQDHLLSSRNESLDQHDYVFSSDDEMLNGTSQASDQEEDDPDGPFAFKRKKGCSYHAPLIDKLGNWPWCAPEEGGLGDKRFRYCLTTLNHENPRCIGFARRRIGRGGRIIFDRAWSQLENCLSQLENNENNDFLEDWIHFRPKTPPEDVISEMSVVEERIVYDEEGNEIPVVPITSLKEYVNENELFSSFKLSSEPDLESFQSHQEELFEMQRKQLERLKKDSQSSANGVNINNLCNRELSEHSSSSKALSSSCSSTISIPQPSTLDSARVHRAVSAVLSTKQVTNILNSTMYTNGPGSTNSNVDTPPSQSNAHKEQTSTTSSLLKMNCQNNRELTTNDSSLPATDVT
ncbi:enhancer of polycomb 1-like protein, partial [Leptotrombidium deliense]